MALTDMTPWGRGRSVTATRPAEDDDPFQALQRDMNRILDNFTRGFGLMPPQPGSRAGMWPHVEVNETDKEIRVAAELPGMDQDDVELSLHDGVLTLKGEKKRERDTAVYSERWHGQFQRSLHVGPDVDPEKIAASFKHGVLTVTLGKRLEAQSQVKRIPIGTA